ncbi:hypothetical protein AVEN_157040-1 [Araneus ventricosus]|uniref:DUF4371 domain-containing protein n=1 Tax=Araneus ventricosus TaxID=182803 RepID=A0A4Y2P4F3_ARAVE|nr:hypothetical protein AVEN_157040-1 [Araneus ventricosus]
MDFIEIGQQFNDAGVRNKWHFEWLKEKDKNKVSFSKWCKKINEVGHCFCFVCPKKINYGNNGSKTSENTTLSLNDRRANQKAVLACFVAENSLPFSLVSKLVELCQTLVKDSPALSKLKMKRTAATYITGYGVAKTMREE